MSSYQRRVLRQNGFRPGSPVRRGRSVSRALADEPVRRRAPERAADPGGRRRPAPVLLAERDHPRPPHGEHRLPHGRDAGRQQRREIDRGTCGPSWTRPRASTPTSPAPWWRPPTARTISPAACGSSRWRRCLSSPDCWRWRAARSRRRWWSRSRSRFAVGWTFLILFLLPIDVDFLTAALAAIVVAVCAGPACCLATARPPARDGVARPAAAAGGRVRRRRCRGFPGPHRLRHPGAARPRCGRSHDPAADAASASRSRCRRRSTGPSGAAACGCRGRARSWRPRVARWPGPRGPRCGAAVQAAAGPRRPARSRAVRRGVPRAGRKVRAVVTSRSRSA